MGTTPCDLAADEGPGAAVGPHRGALGTGIAGGFPPSGRRPFELELLVTRAPEYESLSVAIPWSSSRACG